MFCKNCGVQLNGTENVCPNCGTPVEKITTPGVVQNNGQVANVNTVMPQQANPQQVNPQQYNQGMPPYNQVVPQQNSQQQPSKNSTTIILVIALICVVAIAIVLFIVFSGSNKTTPPTNGGGDTPGTIDVTTTPQNTQSYGGYTFTIPEGYDTRIESSEGLVIYNSSLAFAIAVDYSYSYDDYKQMLQQKYSDQVSTMIKNISGREYMTVLARESGSNRVMYAYVTKADATSTFVGCIANVTFTEPTSNELTILTSVLDSAKNGSSSFGAGSEQDAGKNGLKEFKFDNNLIMKK